MESIKSTDIAERLRDLQSKLGLTVQEMADKCEMPKSSLVNYMNLKGPQRPGVDALVALANGLGTSVDWIVGRTVRNAAFDLAQKDYAFACYSVVISVLFKLVQEHQRQPEKVIDKNGAVLEQAPYEIAALAMLDFITIVEGFAERPSKFKPTLSSQVDSITEMVRKQTGAAYFGALKNREP